MSIAFDSEDENGGLTSVWFDKGKSYNGAEETPLDLPGSRIKSLFEWPNAFDRETDMILRHDSLNAEEKK